ncbi:MAG: galactose-1-phosphate uridylyltransferase [Granulosicoccus sp.]
MLEEGSQVSQSRSGKDQWVQRWHPLLREWVIYSAHRQNRPWSGETMRHTENKLPEHQSDCYLCPGNRRVGGSVNPDYSGVYVFDNDRPSISLDAPVDLQPPPGIYRNKPATGLTRVLCYSPRHNVSMSEMSVPQLAAIVRQWQQQTVELSSIERVQSVCIFENKGEMCGMSNPHPHGQIYATNFVYKSTESHLLAATEHHQSTGRILFQDILASEEAESPECQRIIVQNDSMVAFVPYFARFAYETYIAPRRSVANFAQLASNESADLAAIIKQVLVRMDNLWKMPFPYLMMLHQAPVDGAEYPLFHSYIAFYPPLRTPELRKYVAAHEIGGGNFLADTMPEAKAAELRACSDVHYRDRRT